MYRPAVSAKASFFLGFALLAIVLAMIGFAVRETIPPEVAASKSKKNGKKSRK
jgi:hypothetical protein